MQYIAAEKWPKSGGELQRSLDGHTDPPNNFLQSRNFREDNDGGGDVDAEDGGDDYDDDNHQNFCARKKHPLCIHITLVPPERRVWRCQYGIEHNYNKNLDSWAF